MFCLYVYICIFIYIYIYFYVYKDFNLQYICLFTYIYIFIIICVNVSVYTYGVCAHTEVWALLAGEALLARQLAERRV